MAVDKLSDHYTTAKNYEDFAGNTRSFDIIDHDVKTSIAVKVPTSEELKNLKTDMKTYKDHLIDRILAVPPSLCPTIFHDFTLRGDYTTGIEWNEKMIRDEGIDISKLRDMVTLLEKRLPS